MASSSKRVELKPLIGVMDLVKWEKEVIEREREVIRREMAVEEEEQAMTERETLLRCGIRRELVTKESYDIERLTY